MKPITFGSCALFVSVALVLVEVAIQQPAQSATGNATLQPLSTGVLSPRQPAGGSRASRK